MRGRLVVTSRPRRLCQNRVDQNRVSQNFALTAVSRLIGQDW